MSIVNNKTYRMYFNSSNALVGDTAPVAPSLAWTITWRVGDTLPAQITEDMPNRRWYLYPRSCAVALASAQWATLGDSYLSVWSPTLSAATAGKSWSSGIAGTVANGRLVQAELGDVVLFGGIQENLVIKNEGDLERIGVELQNPTFLAGGNEFTVVVTAAPATAADVGTFNLEGAELAMELELICQDWEPFLNNPRPPVGAGNQMYTWSGNSPSIANINPQPAPAGHATQNFPRR